MTTSRASCASDDLVARVAANLAEVSSRIASTGRSPDSVRVVAVTKSFGVGHVRAAHAVGLSTIGENYVDELADKRNATTDLDLYWHFLGALQTNKISRALLVADVLCGLSRVKEVAVIARHRASASVYVQVDFTGAAGRSGAAPEEVRDLVSRARDAGLNVRGLMTVAPIEPSAARAAFLATSALADSLSLAVRSMGMSDDLELALECGATELRLGRALFGPRKSPSNRQ